MRPYSDGHSCLKCIHNASDEPLIYTAPLRLHLCSHNIFIIFIELLYYYYVYYYLYFYFYFISNYSHKFEPPYIAHDSCSEPLGFNVPICSS